MLAVMARFLPSFMGLPQVKLNGSFYQHFLRFQSAIRWRKDLVTSIMAGDLGIIATSRLGQSAGSALYLGDRIPCHLVDLIGPLFRLQKPSWGGDVNPLKRNLAVIRIFNLTPAWTGYGFFGGPQQGASFEQTVLQFR